MSSSSSEDDDRAMREKLLQEERKRKNKVVKTSASDSKKAKLSHGDVEETADGKICLGKMKHVDVRKFKGQLYVDIREYYLADGDLKPGKKGISLKVDEWNKLKSIIDHIDEKVKRM